MFVSLKGSFWYRNELGHGIEGDSVDQGGCNARDGIVPACFRNVLVRNASQRFFVRLPFRIRDAASMVGRLTDSYGLYCVVGTARRCKSGIFWWAWGDAKMD